MMLIDKDVLIKAMKKITVKLKDGTELVFEEKYSYFDLNQAALEGRQFINISNSYIRIDSIEWIRVDDIEEKENV